MREEYPICDICGGDLEVYDTENFPTDEGLEVVCHGWCPSCRVNYDWTESYLFKAITTKTRRN